MGMPRAARRQPVVLSSSSDDEKDRPQKRRTRGDATTSESKSKSATQRKPSPKKPQASRTSHKTANKSPAKPKSIYKPITSFFGTAPLPKPTQPTPSPTKSAVSLSIDDFDDDILDSDNEDPVQKSQSTVLEVRKRARPTLGRDDHAQPRGSQKFLRTVTGARVTPPPNPSKQPVNIDTRPWNERLGPTSLDELAVHKKKVEAVQIWIQNVFSGKERKRLLLLKGPAGSGKTTTVSLLSKALGVEIHEWKNPTSSTSSSEGFVSVTAQFEEFVRRAGIFGSLTFDAPTRPRHAEPSSGRHQQLILVEEFPNTFTRESSTVQSFRSSILSFLAATTPSATDFFNRTADSTQPITPVVMIISETLLSTNTAAADSFTAHRLLGPEILSHPGVTTIEFNPIAPTFMVKALDLIVAKEARQSGRKRIPGPQVIQKISEIGDIRSAVSTLEFLCVRGDENDGWGAKIDFSKKKTSKDTPLTEMERTSLDIVTQRENTLGIFHAVGRVVYNKRLTEPPGKLLPPQPPNWFPERRRPKASEVEVDSLIDELGTDIHTFIAALHENYVLSCAGADSEETMDSIEGCIDALSDADVLSPDRFGVAGSHRRTFQGTSSDNLRQEEMSYQVSVRGLLYALPSPVKRAAHPPGLLGSKGKGSSKGNPYVMYYPVSLRIWRTQEEIGGLLDMWVSRAQRGELFDFGNVSRKHSLPSAGGVETWRKNSTSVQEKRGGDEPIPPILLGSGGSARYEMLLERLPYLPIILRNSRLSHVVNGSVIRELRKITSFNGGSLMVSDGDQEDVGDDDNEEQDQWSTDRPASPHKTRKNLIRSKDKEPTSSAARAVGNNVAKLVLSDDDIED